MVRWFVTTSAGRLSPEVIALCLAEDGDAVLQSRGVKVIALLRDLKSKLMAATGLIQCLVATQGEAFHHETLANCLSGARSAGIAVAPCIDDLLSVRHVTSLAEATDWSALALILHSGLPEKSASEIRNRGIIHAIEHIMRPSFGNLAVASASAESESKRLAMLSERLKKIQSFIVELRSNKDLLDLDSLAALVNELEQLDIICTFLLSIQDASNFADKESVASVESARTLLGSKTCKLTRCMSCLPGGVMLMEKVQEALADYHGQAALITSMDKAFLSMDKVPILFCFPHVPYSKVRDMYMYMYVYLNIMCI